ncbi:MAG: glycosyltransferase family 2 protein [Pseudomonadota bacterium]|nr:glycosyltransferase family 2 protein [Pseudomonadota bacterium]
MKISVCMATFNGGRFISEQLDSIRMQIESSDEIIIVDDASSDDTVERIRSCHDDRIRIIEHEINLGVVQSFQQALEEATGDIIFLSDQDDLWKKDKVRTVCDIFQSQPETTLVLSDAEILDETGRVTMTSFYALLGAPFKHTVFANLAKNRYMGCVMAFRRTMLNLILPMPAGLPMHDVWIGLLNSIYGKVYFEGRPLIGYRRHQANASQISASSLGCILRWRIRLVYYLLGRMLRVRFFDS